MMRPKWLQPRIGRGHRGNGEDLRKNRQAEVRKDQLDQGGLQENPADGRQGRAGDTQPRTSSFRQEMRPGCARKKPGNRQKRTPRNGKRSGRRPKLTSMAGPRPRKPRPWKTGLRDGRHSGLGRDSKNSREPLLKKAGGERDGNHRTLERNWARGSPGAG